jgi:pimeloyl-ACP methyl ester carboxylesterase
MTWTRSLLYIAACTVLACDQAGRSNQAGTAVQGASLAVASGASHGGRGRPDSGCSNLGVNFGSHKCKILLSTGITMAYLETGPENGPAVILIHGLTDSVRSWILSMRALHARNPGLHIFAIDQRGHGATSMPRGDDCAGAPEDCFQMKDFAADLVDFMHKKGIRRATLVGHSLGSFVVQEVALQHPEMVDRAILIATSTTCVDNVVLRDFVLAEPVEGTWKSNLVAQGFAFPDDVYDLTPINADPYGSPLYMRDIWVADPVADPAFLAPYIPETAQTRLGTWIGASRALLQTDNTARLRKLDVPTMVIWATQDSIFLESPDQTAIRSALAAAAAAHHRTYYWKQYGVLPLPASGNQESDIGHNVQWGAPDSVASDIDSFLRRGVPDPDLTHSAAAPNIRHIVVEPGKAIIVKLGP